MKHQGFIDIQRPRALVVKLFTDPNHQGEYQDGFLKKELLSGAQGMVGAKSLILFKHGKQKMELFETVTTNNLPDYFEAFFHHKHMDNTMKCTFEILDENKTRYHYEYEYIRINWVMPKLMAILFPSMFRKPAEKWLRQFKVFVEQY